MSDKRAQIDYRLVLPRCAAALIAVGWIWFYSETVSAMLEKDRSERDFQDIQIPAGRSRWIAAAAGGAIGAPQQCRGAIEIRLQQVSRRRTAEELNQPTAGDTSLPQTTLGTIQKGVDLTIAGRLVVDLLARRFPARFGGMLYFDDSYTLKNIDGSLDAGGAKFSVSTIASLPLTLKAAMTINGGETAAEYVINEPIMLVLNRAGQGTLKLPRNLRSGLRSALPGHSAAAAAGKVPFSLAAATAEQYDACSGALEAAAGGEKLAPPAINLDRLKINPAAKNIPAKSPTEKQ